MSFNIIPNERIFLDRIEEFEKINLISLPNEYKIFLINYNGGEIVNKNKITFFTTYGKPSWYKIKYFFEIQKLKFLQDENSFLCIGNALSGYNSREHYICINIDKKCDNYGKIYLCDVGGDIDLISEIFFNLSDFQIL